MKYGTERKEEPEQGVCTGRKTAGGKIGRYSVKRGCARCFAPVMPGVMPRPYNKTN